MASYALIIGADAYWTPEASLHGAVRDALEVYDWVTDPGGGGVPERNTTLLLTPGEHSPEIPAGLASGTAGNDDVKTAIARLVQRSGGEGERLFLHFSGHGLSALAGAEEDAIVLADFTPDLTEKSLAVGSIIEYFAATAFQEQFLFFDACRNLAWDGNFQVGRLRAQRRDPLRPAPQQFVCFSTAPGVRAREVEERGAFTAALLAALRGAGPAKAWDDRDWHYVVRWNALFSAVEQAVEAQQIDVGGDLIQRPRQAGERGGANPVLATFLPGSFPAETLRVTLEPAEVGSSAAIEVRDAADAVARESPVLETVSFPLEPRAYTVVASGPGLRPEHRYWAVDLYGPCDVTVRLLPDEASGPSDAAAHEAVQARRTRGLRHGAADARVAVVCADPLAPVEIADLAGTVLATGDGAVEKHGLAAGFYDARVVLPDGVHDEELVSVAAGELERVELDAPDYPLPATPTEPLLGVAITVSGAPLDVRVWGLDEPPPEAEPIPDGGRLLRAVPAGAYLIGLNLQGRPDVTLAVNVPARRSLVVAAQAGPGGLDHVDITTCPGAPEVVLAQRFMAAGRTDHVERLAEEATADPLAAILLGYLPGHATGDVAASWPELPDPHVIAGVAAELSGDLAAAAIAYRAALDRGLPLLARGASILAGAVERHGIEHPRAELLERTVAFNGLWTRLGEPRVRTSPAVELALDRSWQALLGVASADEEQRAVTALAHPELLATATLQRLGERAATKPDDVAGTLAWLHGIATALEAGEQYPLGLGPIEGLWRRVSAGELDPAHAARLARDRRVAEALTPPYLRALSESLIELGDTQLALTRYAILDSAVASRGEAPASFVKDGLQLTARALMSRPDATALETARERGEAAVAAATDAGTEAELLVSLGILYLDPYTADRDSRGYEVDHARWLLRAGDAGALMPEPAEALRLAAAYLRRAIAIEPEPHTLKALAQALMYTEVVGEPVDRAEIVALAVRALALLAPGELPSLRLSLIAMLRHLDQPVDADAVRATLVHSLDEYARQFGDRVALDILVSTRWRSRRSFRSWPRVVIEARGLVERIGDDRLREQALDSELRFLRRAYTRLRFDERPEGGARAAAEAVRERARVDDWDVRDLAATLVELGNASVGWDEEAGRARAARRGAGARAADAARARRGGRAPARGPAGQHRLAARRRGRRGRSDRGLRPGPGRPAPAEAARQGGGLSPAHRRPRAARRRRGRADGRPRARAAGGAGRATRRRAGHGADPALLQAGDRRTGRPAGESGGLRAAARSRQGPAFRHRALRRQALRRGRGGTRAARADRGAPGPVAQLRRCARIARSLAAARRRGAAERRGPRPAAPWSDRGRAACQSPAALRRAPLPAAADRRLGARGGTARHRRDRKRAGRTHRPGDDVRGRRPTRRRRDPHADHHPRGVPRRDRGDRLPRFDRDDRRCRDDPDRVPCQRAAARPARRPGRRRGDGLRTAAARV